MPALVLGPILRYVDEHAATIWLQTDGPCEVEVLGARTRTFCVDGHHFALVALEGLAAGAELAYEVRLDGAVVWPQAGSAFPPSVLRTLRGGSARREVVFGSCRLTRPHEPPYVLRQTEHEEGHGVDALRVYALRAAAAGGAGACPDMILLLGDQIYADEPSAGLQAEIAARTGRPADAPPDELADFTDYALAYAEAWREPAIRWLLSTVPVTMVFDDHEIHAEWRISDGWLEEMHAEPWFERHIRGGLMAYWVFQHLGNHAPAALAADELLAEVRGADDGAGVLGSWLATAGRQAGHSRWSYARELGDAQLVVIDSRAGRDVTPGRRALIQDEEWAWVREQAERPAKHLLLASSIPFFLAPGLHHVEAFDEALTEGGWGRAGRVVGEKLRRLAVMDHWAAFQRSFRGVADLLRDVAGGHVGEPPVSIVMLSGDVHHCYLAEVGFPPGADGRPRTVVWQAVCSAFRKELAPHERRMLAFGHTPLGERIARRLSKAVGVPPTGIDWRVVERPAYANQVGTIVLEGDHVRVRVEAVEGDWGSPRLATAFERVLC